ncbi:Histidinol-phosphatase [Polystyrenella longa]|uniref:Histidinol-phosphatase n=1 Tax=Polystyrenella longa TaxID=2528007 RepID=A0A518CN19_9PLAN|nr:inositol monophosphatase family protein [Polystyrenella longa]QDU80594.1 Histidinol-phosphatase [Polystyrenella longa]
MTSEIESRLELALKLAEEAQVFILKHYQHKDLEVEVKGDFSPVTIADRGAEELIRKRLAEVHPEDGVQGEEFDDKESQNGYKWILDPIDGTKSFVHGIPLFGTLIGIEKDGEMVAGLCRFPGLDEVVYARRGGGAWWKKGANAPEQCHVSTVSKLSESLVCITDIKLWDTKGIRDLLSDLGSEARLLRNWGDCYGHAMVATGRAEVILEPEMNPWDASPFLPILEEAGGHYLNWDGEATIYGSNGISVNAALKDQFIEMLNPRQS